uniref:MADS41 n=1 Tax=Apostasia odorata TaxID=280455 RepID=A0A1L1WL26_9ASPA|nr:MADS41 [Apostasia odorata]
MGRGKIEIKRIENPTNRQVTFSKRRGGLLKKAHELAVLTDAQVGLVVFSTSGKMYDYCSPASSMREIIERYLKATNAHFDQDHSSQQQLYCEITRIRHETDRLQATIKQFTGEELSGLTINDLNQLEDHLEFSVNKVRFRKHQLLHQQLENLRRKVVNVFVVRHGAQEHILEDQNNYLCRAVSIDQKLS